MWTHSQMTSTYKPREEASEWNLLCWHLDLGLLSLQTVKNKFLLFKSPKLWHFVLAVWTFTLSTPSFSQCGLFQIRPHQWICIWAYSVSPALSFPLFHCSLYPQCWVFDSSRFVQYLRPGNQTYIFFSEWFNVCLVKSDCLCLGNSNFKKTWFPRLLVLQVVTRKGTGTRADLPRASLKCGGSWLRAGKILPHKSRCFWEYIY